MLVIFVGWADAKHPLSTQVISFLLSSDLMLSNLKLNCVNSLNQDLHANAKTLKLLWKGVANSLKNPPIRYKYLFRYSQTWILDQDYPTQTGI